MSKKTSKSSYFAEQRKNKILEQQKIKRRNAFFKKCATVLACIAALALCAVLCVQVVLNSGVVLKKNVLESENFSVTAGMMSYYIYEQNYSFAKYYGASISDIYNPDKSLKNQDYTSDKSFFQFFADTAYNNVINYLYLCEDAKSDGFDLSEETKTALKERAYSLDPEKYGRGLSSEDIYNAIYLSVLAAEYSSNLYNELAPKAEEIEEYKEKSPIFCQNVDYLMYTVSYAKDDKAAKEKAQKGADDIAAAKNKEEFKAAVLKYLTDGKVTSLDKADSATQKIVNGVEYTGAVYNNDEAGNWLFKKAQVGDTRVIEDTTKNCYYVFMLTTAPFIDTQKTVDVRHILISFDNFESKEQAKAEAERIYQLFKDGNGSEQDFAALAYRYSDDEGSFATGGLYERIRKGEMVTEYDNWCFDESRKYGDTGLISTSFGYHIMFFCEDNIPNWQLNYFNTAAGEAANNALAEMQKNYTINADINKIYAIPEVK
ncbi:MAG: peptidyl-prolyl cis-trans isomerase [Clostridia bacterium]|nr:peptidyl-prolyl cis-trans isomerase [Clostridia bacterium]